MIPLYIAYEFKGLAGKSFNNLEIVKKRIDHSAGYVAYSIKNKIYYAVWLQPYGDATYKYISRYSSIYRSSVAEGCYRVYAVPAILEIMGY